MTSAASGATEPAQTPALPGRHPQGPSGQSRLVDALLELFQRLFSSLDPALQAPDTLAHVGVIDRLVVGHGLEEGLDLVEVQFSDLQVLVPAGDVLELL